MKRVITYGTFDLLHYGHINLLRRAKALGDYLIVVASSDEFNWNEKHKKKYFSYEEKKALLEAIRYVDLVIPEENWQQKRRDIHEYHIDGSAIKYLGEDVKEEGKSFKGKSTSKESVFYTQSQFDEYVFKRAFHIDDSTFKRFGLPRNDELANISPAKVDEIKEQLSLPKDKKILLYAPTFREYCRNATNEIMQEMRIDLQLWEKTMGDRYVLLVRVHYEVAKTLDFATHNSVHNVSDYPHLNDLLIISDALISDYSSIYFDYSILHRPMVCFAYDIDEYTKNRGMYIDLRKELPCKIVQTNDELFSKVERVFEQYEEMCEKTVEFQKKYVSEYGSASKKTCDYLAKMIEQIG